MSVLASSYICKALCTQSSNLQQVTYRNNTKVVTKGNDTRNRLYMWAISVVVVTHRISTEIRQGGPAKTQ